MADGQTWIFQSDGAGGGLWLCRGRTSIPDLAGPATLPPASNLNPELVFELEPLRPSLRLSNKKVAPHLFVTGMLGGDVGANNNHWWIDRMPGGSVRETDGDWLVRDKPYDPWEGQRPRPDAGGVSFQVLDKVWELQQLIAAGFDGGWVDWLNVNDGVSDNRTGQVKDYIRAVAIADPTGYTKVAPMIDGNTSIGQVANLDALLQKTADIAAMPGAWRWSDGGLLIPVYMPEGSAASTHDATATVVQGHYTTYATRLASERGVQGRFWWCPQRGAGSTQAVPGWYGTQPKTSTFGGQGFGQAVANVPGTIGMSRWGTRDPDTTLKADSQNAGAAAFCHQTLGLLWCQPVSVQDERPNQNTYWESQGFGQLLASWQVAIENGADWVQVPTWSDYPEHAHIGPSLHHGWVWLDLMSYYLTRFKLGAFPTVVRDGLYIAHRIHPSSGYTNQRVNDLASPATPIPAQVLQPSTAAADIVDVLVFLTTTVGTEVRITSGGVQSGPLYPTDATKAYGGAGVYRFSVPLVPGPPPQAEIRRGGVTVAVVASTWPVTTTPLVQDMHYRCASSLRQKVGAPA